MKKFSNKLHKVFIFFITTALVQIKRASPVADSLAGMGMGQGTKPGLEIWSIITVTMPWGKLFSLLRPLFPEAKTEYKTPFGVAQIQ